MNKAILQLGAVAVVFAATPSSAAELLQNGNFSSGLTGWTSYLTANGTISPSNPNQGGVTPSNSPAEIAVFDVKGNGTASNAAWLNAGQHLPPYGTANPAGGGISQTFTSTTGVATFTVDLAARTNFSGDAGGTFSVLLDGVVLDSVDLGAITGTVRNSLDFSTNLTAGSHTLALQVVRPFAPARNLRSQYFDNASLNFVAVPEPGTWALMIVGFGAVGSAVRRRQQVKARISYAA